MKLITVRNKIIVIVIGIVLIFAPFLFYYFPNQQRVILTNGYDKEVSNIATTVALGVNIALDEQNFAGVETAMKYAKSDDRLIFVALLQIDTIIDEKGNSSTETTEFIVFPEGFIVDPDLQTSDSIVVNSASIQSKMLNGEVMVGFSTDSILATISELRYDSLIGSIIVSLIGILLGLWLARSISKPIMQLRRATYRVSLGDLEQSVLVNSKDEIGDLSKSFNLMVSQLNISEKELTLQKELVEEKNKGMIDSISYAKRIQDAILPSGKEIKESFNDSFVLFMPKDIVSGDFYWLENLEEKTLISVADCTGHGVPGAFVSLVCSNALNLSVKEHNITEPALILDKTNSLIRNHFEHDGSKEEMRDGMDISLCSLTKGKETIEYAGALNPLWIVSDKTPMDNGDKMESILSEENNHLFEIKGDKQPIGRYVEQKPFTNHTVNLKKGDVIYLFSDGFSDQFGGKKGKKLKSKTFKKHLLSIWKKPLKEQKLILEKTIKDWMGDIEQVDDICIIGIRI